MRHYVVKNFLHVSLSMIVLFFTNKYAAYNKKKYIYNTFILLKTLQKYFNDCLSFKTINRHILDI